MIEYYKELLYYIQKRTSCRDYAQDIIQETYVKVIAVQNKQKLNNPRAFLYKVAKNIIIDKARKSIKFQEIPYEENEYTVKTQQPEEIVLEQNMQMILMQEIQKLPDMRKEAFVLHVVEGHTRQEVARKMKISLNAVDKHISRASIQLKEKLRDKESKS